MLRRRMTGRRLTKDRLRFLAEDIKEHQIDRAKMTTCQTIQLHNLTGDAVVDLMKKAVDVNIITRGGGDFPRNVMVNPLSGVEQNEYFDVFPWAEAAAEYMLTLIETLHLPRKLKVAFSNNESNVTHATFRDLGFVARKNGRTFYSQLPSCRRCLTGWISGSTLPYNKRHGRGGRTSFP